MMHRISTHETNGSADRSSLRSGGQLQDLQRSVNIKFQGQHCYIRGHQQSLSYLLSLFASTISLTKREYETIKLDPFCHLWDSICYRPIHVI
jgi:hypothetical protein